MEKFTVMVYAFQGIMSTITFRLIESDDNCEIASLTRALFREFRIDQPGTVYIYPITDHLYELFRHPESV